MSGGGPDIAAWIGRMETVHDMVTAAQAQGMSATLDRSDAPPQAGDPLPPMWQWMFFTPKVRQSEVGEDGHPRRGGFMPPVALPRRMFAGGRFTFHDALRVGDAIERRAEILNVTEKQGRSGRLVFVTVGHAISTPRGLAITEENDIVYREAATGPQMQGPGAAPEAQPAWRRAVTPDPVLLFRFSALTFNSHRIHYDRPYASEVEGYPGLVVHGPLLATLLCDLVRDHADRAIAGFRFQARRPVFAPAPVTLIGGARDGGYWAQAVDESGAVAMEAEGEFF